MVCRNPAPLSSRNISRPILIASSSFAVVVRLAAFRALLIDGMRMPISKVMMKITVSSSTSEKAVALLRGRSACPPGEWNACESGHPYVFADVDGQTYLFYQGNNDMGQTWYPSYVKVEWDSGYPRLK